MPLSLRTATPPPSPLWRGLCQDEWLLTATLAFVEDCGDDVHWLWLLALDDGLTSLRARLEQHGAVNVAHARRLAMAYSRWSTLRKLSGYTKYPRGRKLSEAQVDEIERELARLGVAPHPDRRAALLNAVALDHKSGEKTPRPQSCPHCARRFSHECAGAFHRCTAPGPRDNQHFCRATSHCLMYAAASAGRLESVVWLHFVVCYDQERALSLAARQGHADVVTWLLDHAHANSITVDFRFRDDAALGLACWRATHFSQCYTMSLTWGVDQSLSDYSAACLAARHGDVDVLRRLYAHPHTLFRAEWTSRLALRATSSGHVVVLDCLFELCPDMFTDSSVMWAALKDGHLEVAQWLVAHNCGGTVDNPRNVRAAVLCGRVDVLQWMLSVASDPAGMRREMLARADECTSQAAFEWLVRELGLKLLIAVHAKTAVSRSHTALAKWIVGTCTAKRPLTGGRELLETAITRNNLELVQWFVEDFGVWSPRAFPLAALGRSTAMLSYIHDAGNLIIPSSTPATVKLRIQFDPSCLEWFLDHGFRSGLFDSEALDAVRSIERDYAKTQLALGTRYVTYESQTMRRFRDAICRVIQVYDVAYLRRVKWLPLWAARHGSLDALKRLIEIDSRNAFTRRRFDKLLSENAREPVVKWLLEHQPTLFTTLVVRWAVTNGNRGVIQWVFESFLPLHADTLDTDPVILVRKCVRTALWHAASRGSRGGDILVMMKRWAPAASDCSVWRGIDEKSLR